MDETRNKIFHELPVLSADAHLQHQNKRTKSLSYFSLQRSLLVERTERIEECKTLVFMIYNFV